MGLKKKERKKKKKKKKKKLWSGSEEEGKKEKERRRRRRKKKKRWSVGLKKKQRRRERKGKRRRRKKEERGIAVGDEWFDLTTHKSWPPQSPYIYQRATELCNSEIENTNLVFLVFCIVAQFKLSLSDENNERKSSQTQYFQWVPHNS